MKFLKKIVSSSNFWPLLIVLISAILAGRTFLTPGYFNMHDDLQMMRQLEMEKCFLDGQIPCRWVPDMGYGFGFPLFNYYPPLPYLVGELFRIAHFSFVDTAKILFLLAFMASGLTMYYLAKEFFGKWGGVVSSVFYVWAPYHSVDAYVRGAMNESWALIWFPLILLTSYKLIVQKSKTTRWIIALGLSWTGLLLSHNLMVLIFTPVFAGWCLLFWLKAKGWKKIWELLKAGLLAAGLSAFFTLPAAFEQKYVHVDTLVKGYYEYIAHFATINQLLFSRFWGYGPSVWGINDGMSFQIGHIHWILSILIGIVVVAMFLGKNKSKLSRQTLFTILYIFLAGWFAAFMAHEKSTFIWKLFSPLAFVQFPWRFLTIVILCFSFIAGSVVILFPNKIIKFIAPIVLVGLIVWNWNYFLPQGGKMGPLTDTQKFSGAAWDLQRTAGIFDYLPQAARENPKEGQKLLAEFMTGKGSVESPKEGTNWASFNINADSASTIRVGIFQYPVWKTYIDGKEVKNYVPESEAWGRMYIDVAAGRHIITLRLYNTPLRSVANIISLLTWISLLAFAMRRLRMVQFRRG